MGELLNKVLEIHNSRMNEDLSDYNINKNISLINEKILEAARNGITSTYINFESYNSTIATAVSRDESMYTYCLHELNSASHIKQKLIEYYTNEEFNVKNGSYLITISWSDKISKIGE